MVNHGNNSEIADLKRRVSQLERGSPHNNASVSRGAFQILSSDGLIVGVEGGGGGSEKIFGQWRLVGDGFVTGRLFLQDGSLLEINGTLNGDGDITWTGPAHFRGEFKTSEGGVELGGPVSIKDTLDVDADTRLKARVRVEDDFEIINGGKFKAGPIEMDPASHNGSIRWGSGQEILSQSGALELYSAGGIKYGIQLKPDGVHIPLMERVESGGIDDLDFIAFRRPSGKLVRVSQDVGSPLGGDLIWIFDPATIDDGYGPRVSPGGIGSTFHRGVDWPIPMGTPIPAAGKGTVVFAGGDPGAGFGYHVEIQHDPRTVTRYAHLQSPPPVSVGDFVTQKQIIGYCGSTGTSTGPHLHFEVLRDGVQVDPEGYITAPWVPF